VYIIADVQQIAADAAIGMFCMTPHPEAERFGLYRCVPDMTVYAAELYEFFREADRVGLKSIFCESVPAIGLGMAVMDRLSRAAEA